MADIAYDPVVARSEFEHSARNAAIGWLMKSFGNFHNDVATVLQNYFHYCSLEMSCVELARTFLFLADRGIAPHLDAPVIAPIQSRQVNALMMTSGMYQNAGESAWRVGLPAKSGVGGGSWRLSRRRWRSPCGARSLTTPELAGRRGDTGKTDSADGEVGVLMVDQIACLRAWRARRSLTLPSGGKSGNTVSIRDRRLSIGMPQTLFASGWRPLRRSMMASRRRCAVTRCLSPSTRPLPAVAAAWKNGMPFPTAAR